jgi:tape measure domain-containing protein
MANKITIDMELRFIDNATGGAKATSRALDKVEKEAKEAGREIDNLAKKKAKPSIDAETSKVDRKLSKLDSTLRKFGLRKTKTTVDVDDKATAKISRALNKLKSWSGKKFNAFLELKDSNALRTLNKVSDGLRNLTRKVFRVPVKILDYATAPLRALKNTLFSIKGLVAAITAGLAAQNLVVKPISLADQYSSAQIGFSTLLGESRGQQMMDDLDAFAKATPFKSAEVISQTQRMLAMGWDAERIINDMRTIGDAAAATGKGEQGLQQIVTALAQIKTKGRLSTEELNQLAEAGISAKRYLAEGLGYGTGDEGIAAMTKDLEDGAIASNVALDALLSGMMEYKGMMDKTANETVTGLWSQIEDTFEINIFRRWGQGLQDGAKRGFGSVVELLNEADGALTEFGDTIYDIGRNISDWLADKFENAIGRITEITDSYEFKNASLKDKVSMLWNGVIADPLSEWWEGGGREKTAETAGKIGSWMGEMLTKGLLALFGATDVLDEGIGSEAGSSIAGSFVQGFMDNFDGSAITDAFVNAIGNVWGALPGWAKVLIGGYGVGKAAGGLAGFAGGVGSFIGGAKNIFGSASAMTGLFGLGTKAAIGMGAGNLAGGASLGAGLLSALGLGGIAGGLAGGASLIKGGFDLYKGYTTNDAIEAQASRNSGWAKIGGVAGGAAIGATLGSVIPGLGTLLGGLLGAGIGGIGGWLLGDYEADKIRATDDAINDVTAAVQDLETEEEKLAAKNKMVWQNMKDHFGDIKLSMTEIKRLADQVVWGKDLAVYEKFTSATKQAEASLKSMKSSAEQINRWMWKAGLGVKFNSDEIESIVASFDEYIASAKSFVENKHYEFTASVGLLVDVESKDGKRILDSGNAFYTKIQDQLNDLGKQLSGKVSIALEDGVITLNEQAEITNLQQQIASITEKLANAEAKAELELIRVKFGSGNLDLDSFDTFMKQMETTLNERMEANDKAFKVSVASLQLQLQEGAISEAEYNSQLQTLVDGYTAKVESVKAEILNVELDIIGDAYGISKDKLSKALQDSLAQGIDPISWTTEQARQFIGIDSLSESTAGALAQMLGGIAQQLQLVEVDGNLMLKLGVAVPQDTAARVKKAVDDSVPDALTEEVIIGIDGKKSIIRRLALNGGDFGIMSSYTFTPTVNVSPVKGSVSPIRVGPVALQEFRGGIVGGSSALESFARGGVTGFDGGIVRGGSKLIEVAEEGSPEMIIPLSSQRRDRALQLWKKAGSMLGVDRFFRGGVTDNSADARARSQYYGFAGNAGGGQSVRVDVGGVQIDVHVDAADGQTVAAVIKEKLAEAADDIAGIFADAFGAQFENTPVRGGN